ncbi:MAG: TetR/AcrR family transcriptional regulator [Nocardioidaceae bacterium]|nr:TetR/AcrR family transcriptional regulator [Nocardioidaceae bacterium]
MTPRAPALPPAERKKALLTAARAIVLEHGSAATTKLIAEAAGVAEGTLFRVFASKDELFDALIDAEFDPDPFLARLGEIDVRQPLEDRLVEAVGLLQQRFASIFRLMIALGVRKPPERLNSPELRERLQTEGLIRLVEPDAGRFRIPPGEVVQLLRLLTFSGTHPHISEPRMLTAPQIVDTVLHGVLLPAERKA